RHTRSYGDWSSDVCSSDLFLRSDTANATSTASTFLTITQNGAGKIAEFFGPTSASVLSLLSGGNVGIGTTTPGTLLSLGNTGARSEERRVGKECRSRSSRE